jgi:hypothetical protein
MYIDPATGGLFNAIICFLTCILPLLIIGGIAWAIKNKKRGR